VSTAVVRDELALGMPHLGPHGLSETALFEHLGHRRWQSFAELAGVPSSQVADARGRRLYATFYHVDVEFPLSAPPHAFREDDRVVWVGGLAAHGRNILDGCFALYRAGDARIEAWGAPEAERRSRFLDGGIPVVQLSNIFIAQEAGPELLQIGQPANADYARIPACATPPEGYARNQEARVRGRFFDPPEGARPAEMAAVAVEHPIDPDRDVNGAGLVYFARFPAVLHAAERRAAAALPGGGLPRGFVDRRGTLRRQLGFFANARVDDTLRVAAECAVLPEPLLADTPPRPYGAVWFNARLERVSDGRLVAISTAVRITPLEGDDLPRWRDYVARLA
jgi:probable biosynthetic protein (TIGR04098 family)